MNGPEGATSTHAKDEGVDPKGAPGAVAEGLGEVGAAGVLGLAPLVAAGTVPVPAGGLGMAGGEVMLLGDAPAGDGEEPGAGVALGVPVVGVVPVGVALGEEDAGAVGEAPVEGGVEPGAEVALGVPGVVGVLPVGLALGDEEPVTVGVEVGDPPEPGVGLEPLAGDGWGCWTGVPGGLLGEVPSVGDAAGDTLPGEAV